MTIAVGHILDKYELLEKVGHGGMAVVYRGMDRSLRRQVAIKVLHRHLADFSEARERFEREAHAVAKLRHENILEIFDFSGNATEESYIVTEFIDGETLRDFTAEHTIGYPEIGAMIMLQICRALGHAHGLGILHRDVKPENIMIRSDGIVKLTDFGIAQMLDMRRMTVTGQLLGSPAYMAPEHVDGGKLDFRTDVFAVGVVLYQLVTGELPFDGKNPHEILKRIAECNFVDPRKKNPMVGNELGRIIIKAMARCPDDRFGDITEMVTALERYLFGSGLRDSKGELARFFAAPVPYELALRERLLGHLTARGRSLLATDRVAALELFNRVLSIDSGNREVLGIIDRMSRSRRWLHGALLIGGVLAMSAAVWAGRELTIDRSSSAEPRWETPDIEPDDQPRPVVPRESALVRSAAKRAGDSGAEASSRGRDATTHPDAQPGAAGDPLRDNGRRPSTQEPVSPDRNAGDGNPGRRSIEPSPSRAFTLHVSQRKSEYRVDDGPWQPVPGNRAALSVGPGSHTVEVRNQICCQAARYDISASKPGGETIPVTLGYLPAILTLSCRKPGVRVQVDNKSVPLGHKTVIPISDALGRQSVTVVFIGERTDEQVVTLRYNETRVVLCQLD